MDTFGRRRFGQVVLTIALVVGAATCLGLILRDAAAGAISPDNREAALGRLAGMYFPLLAFILASSKKQSRGTKAPGALVAAVLTIVLWTWSPLFMMAIHMKIEDVLDALAKLTYAGDVLAPMALAVFFARAD